MGRFLRGLCLIVFFTLFTLSLLQIGHHGLSGGERGIATIGVIADSEPSQTPGDLISAGGVAVGAILGGWGTYLATKAVEKRKTQDQRMQEVQDKLIEYGKAVAGYINADNDAIRAAQDLDMQMKSADLSAAISRTGDSTLPQYLQTLLGSINAIKSAQGYQAKADVFGQQFKVTFDLLFEYAGSHMSKGKAA